MRLWHRWKAGIARLRKGRGAAQKAAWPESPYEVPQELLPKKTRAWTPGEPIPPGGIPVEIYWEENLTNSWVEFPDDTDKEVKTFMNDGKNMEEQKRVEMEYMYLCDPEKHADCPKRVCAYVKSRPQGRCYQTPKLEYAWMNLAGEPIITYAHEKVAVTQIPRALPPEKKPFHERFWWLPAAIGLIAIAASGAGVLIAALA